MGGCVIHGIATSINLSVCVLVSALFVSVTTKTVNLAILGLTLPVCDLFDYANLLLNINNTTCFSLGGVSRPRHIGALCDRLIVFTILLKATIVVLVGLFAQPLTAVLKTGSRAVNVTVGCLQLVSVSTPIAVTGCVSIGFVHGSGRPNLAVHTTLVRDFIIVVFS